MSGSASFLHVQLAHTSVDEAFPAVDCGLEPFGTRVVIQIRRAKNKTASGLYITDDTKDAERWNCQVGKVVAIGPLAFRSRTTMEPWPEGSWYMVGDFVRFPKYGGDKWQVDIPGSDEPALFVLFEELDVYGKYTGDPLKVKAFV